MRKVPIGIQSFSKIREIGAYYIDKTRLIDDILSEYGTEVFLFTRPRRFGKSVNLSMLDSYLNVEYAGNRWFDGLGISGIRPDDPEKNAYPVIYLDMKELDTGSFDSFIGDVRLQIALDCRRHQEILGSDRVNQYDKEVFEGLLTRTSDNTSLMRSLNLLSMIYETHYGARTVILIDEYDSPLNSSYGQPHHRQILDYVRAFMTSGLGGNRSLRLGVIMGVMQVGREGVLSDLNNLVVDNMLSTDMDDKFGFTPDEVRKLCSDQGHPERFDEAREWYDGYRFGNSGIYNPWSILRYVNSGFKAEPYWAGTSGNGIIDDLLFVPDQRTYDNLMTLGSGGSIESELDPTVTFADISDRSEGIYTVMALTGYLTASPRDDGSVLYIPNKEMFTVFADKISSKMEVRGMTPAMRRLSKAILSGDTATISETLGDLLMLAVSSRVLDDEHSYQAFLTGLLMNLLGNYRITADHESGEGYHDIRMERIGGTGSHVVVEIKRSAKERPSAEDMSALARSALDQIKDRGYAHGLRGRTLLYGMAFDGKTPTTLFEETLLRPRDA